MHTQELQNLLVKCEFKIQTRIKAVNSTRSNPHLSSLIVSSTDPENIPNYIYKLKSALEAFVHMQELLDLLVKCENKIQTRINIQSRMCIIFTILLTTDPKNIVKEI